MEELTLSDIYLILQALNDLYIKYELVSREFFKINDIESVDESIEMQKETARIIKIIEEEKKERQNEILSDVPPKFET